MIYEVFSVHDEKADAFLPPFILPNIAMAKRAFGNCVNSQNHQFAENPADFTLFRLGQFNDESAEFYLERAKQSLGNGVEYRSPDHPKSPELGNGKANESIEAVTNVAPVFSGAAGENPPE